MSSCACWIPAVTSLGTLVLHALLLLLLYIMLSRKIAQHSHGMETSSNPGDHPRAQPSPASASSPAGDRTQNPRAQKPSPAYAGSSDTSSDTSEDSDNPSCPQVPREKISSENIHYTSLVFPGKGHQPGSAQDYKNVKSAMDYVNVDPKERKIHFCPFSSPEGSKGVEYTEVKL
ncbi:regulator of hemoglobinization and erythroid cell expansion protein [Poecile atricapillus]|uniref:regulator of hemoglobinization and erythroid cell expansion protein n=1 Tax=Poecile atricapillus TaxID=48891 RepID=UPI0027391611|nr:regulator of hemoglobinization and erythroid cell expansion protein [Poecile atricapillus]